MHCVSSLTQGKCGVTQKTFSCIFQHIWSNPTVAWKRYAWERSSKAVWRCTRPDSDHVHLSCDQRPGTDASDSVLYEWAETSDYSIQIQEIKLGRSDSRFKTCQWNRKQTVGAQYLVVELHKFIATANICCRARQDSTKGNGREQTQRCWNKEETSWGEGGAILIKCFVLPYAILHAIWYGL